MGIVRARTATAIIQFLRVRNPVYSEDLAKSKTLSFVQLGDPLL